MWSSDRLRDSHRWKLKLQMSTLVTSQLCFCFSKTMNCLFGTLELRSFNLFLFYLTSVVFSKYWKSRRGQCSGLFLFAIWIKRQSKIAREVKFARIAHGWQFYIKNTGCWKWRAFWKNRKVCGDLFFVIWIFADFKAETSRKNSRYPKQRGN